MKYIIKNCPAFLGKNIQCASYPVCCQDKTNCILKRIVDRCKSLGNNFDYVRGVNYTANEILLMFRIEECEE